jgi:hypothetical protein
MHAGNLNSCSIIRKCQVRCLSGCSVRRQNRFINDLFEVAA